MAQRDGAAATFSLPPCGGGPGWGGERPGYASLPRKGGGNWKSRSEQGQPRDGDVAAEADVHVAAGPAAAAVVVSVVVQAVALAAEAERQRFRVERAEDHLR